MPAPEATSPAPAGQTTAVDALLILFEALSPAERSEAFSRLAISNARHEAATDSDTERMLRSLELVAEAAGRTPPRITDYRKYGPKLAAAGENIVPFNELYNHFDRKWSRVEYAFGLIRTDTARQIERRVQARRTGKVWRYTERQLGDTLEACSAWWAAKARLPAGERFAPLVSEFDQWREQEMELARARGDVGQPLPSATPYRRRWNTWEDALVHFGFTPDQLAERLARIPEPVPPSVPERDMPAGLPAADLADDTPDGLDPAFASAVRDAYRGLPERGRYILTTRLGLDGAPASSFREIGPALHVHFTTVHLAERRAIATLQAACSPAGRLTDRERIAHVLRLLACGSRSSARRQ